MNINERRWFLNRRRGITLIVSLMLIVFAGITVLGITTFIIQRLSQNEVNRVRTRCIYLAQAGIHNAIYWYRFNDLSASGYFSLGATPINTDNSFVLGGSQGDLLMVDTSNWHWGPLTGPGGLRYRQLLGLKIQDATDTNALTIVGMLVSWDNTTRIKAISIGGSECWNGNKSSPVICDIQDFELKAIAGVAPEIYNIDYLDFSGNMNGATIDITFNMSDGTIRQIELAPAGNTDNKFTVKSTGKTTGSNIYRTIRADYNALTAKITNYSEIDEEITP